jgi:hypothetical protein
VAWGFNIEEILALDKISDPEVAFRIPKNFKFKFIKLLMFGIFFLIFIFLRNFRNKNSFNISSIRSDLDLLASCGLAEDTECDCGASARFQADIDSDFILVLIVDHVDRSLACLELLVALDLYLIDPDRDIGEGT